MLGDIGLCDTEKVILRRLASCFIKHLRRAAPDSWTNLDILLTGKRPPGQMADNVSDFVGHIGAPETLLVSLELLMTCTQRLISSKQPWQAAKHDVLRYSAWSCAAEILHCHRMQEFVSPSTTCLTAHSNRSLTTPPYKTYCRVHPRVNSRHGMMESWEERKSTRT
jgi:hypothetical protein